MDKELIKTQVLNALPSATFDETGEWLNILVEPQYWKPLAHHLQSPAGLNFDYMFCITCIDWKTHFTMVYHLTSTAHRNTIVVKAKLDREHPEIETVSHLWRTAEFHEREVYDLFGVNFLHHPDLRRLFLTDEWNGYPLRKDYDDPVNMIKL